MTGREMDARVAEEVMGWEPRHDPDAGRTWLRADHMKAVYPCGLPAYSTEYAAAFEVVERLWTLGFFVQIDTAPSGLCSVYVYKTNPKLKAGGSVPFDALHVEVSRCDDRSVREAICEAALKAMDS